MEQGPTPTEEHCEGCDKLLCDLVAGLSPSLRHALGHPLRRRILRTLSDLRSPRAPHEIAILTIPRPPVGMVSYHAGVLAQLGCLRVAGTRLDENGGVPLYVSAVAGDRTVLSILQATRQLDRDDA